MSAGAIALPPGAELVSSGDSGGSLPPGATLVSGSVPNQAYQQPEGSAAGRAASGFWDYTGGSLLGMVKGLASAVAQSAPGKPLIIDPNSAAGKMIAGVVQSHIDQAQKAKDALSRGRYSEALGHSLATVLPFVGPAAANIAETAGGNQPKFDKYGNVTEPGKAQDIPRAVGQLAGAAASVFGPKAIGKVADVTGASDAAGNAADWAAQRLRTGALRGGFTVKTDPAAVAEAADTMGQQGVGLSDEGVKKISQAITDLQLEKQGRLSDAAQDMGATIDPRAVATRIDQAKASAASQANPQKDLADMEKVKQNFLAANPNPIPVDRAEAIKEGTYSHNNYAPKDSEIATSEAEKAVARGIKEEIENQFPEIRELNAQQQKLINLNGILETAVRKYTNSGGFVNSVKKSLNTGVAKGAAMLGSAGAIAVHSPLVAGGTAAAELVTAILSDPAMKARLAAGIDWGSANAAKAGKAVSTVAPSAPGFARVNALVSALTPQNQQQQ